MEEIKIDFYNPQIDLFNLELSNLDFYNLGLEKYNPNIAV